jgi:dephospho-CoA kinase
MSAGPTAHPEPARALRIGLTGPIGCGKSTVAGWLREHGAAVIDADDVARDVTAPGQPSLAAIFAAFGNAVRAPDGSLDRGALGRIVFSDLNRLRALEAIVHPAVRPRLLASVGDAERDGAPIVVIEAIRLVEGGLAELCDEIWLIVCGEADQRARLGSRQWGEDESDRRMSAQRGIVDRLRPLVTRELDTSGTRDAARSRAFAALDEALAVRRQAS